jgi:hypothetical protein
LRISNQLEDLSMLRNGRGRDSPARKQALQSVVADQEVAVVLNRVKESPFGRRVPESLESDGSPHPIAPEQRGIREHFNQLVRGRLIWRKGMDLLNFITYLGTHWIEQLSREAR